jgi:hypothetical protein
MPNFSGRPFRYIAAGLALMASMGACKEFTSIDASLPNVTDSHVVYALNGSPPGSPNAVKFFNGAVVRADQSFGYDIVFDIDDNGNVVLIPSRAIATNFSNPYSVALRTVGGSFESVLEAPKDGYRPDTALTIPVGQTVVIESRDHLGVCLYSLKGQSYFTKIVVSDVDPIKRTLNFTLTVNRNCGFRSFAPGIPND